MVETARFEGPEISDVIVSFDPETLVRQPVLAAEAIAKLCAPGSAYARAVVRSLPTDADGCLDNHAVDEVLVRAHAEMQRLWEEFFHGPRVADVLRALVAAVRATGITRRLRVVDVGCGAGYVLRWLAAHGVLASEVEWVGADYNAALIARAVRLAAAENLDVKFVVANAFTLEQPGDIYLSSGVLHHFRGADLDRFFEAQAAQQPLAFAHFDPQQSWLAPLGSFLFHAARMREPLARYDGWLSAARAHPGPALEAVATEHAAGLRVARYHPPAPFLPMIRTMTGVIGVPRDGAQAFETQCDEPLRWLAP